MLTGAMAKDGQIRLLTDGSENYIQVIGGRNDDWRIQASTDLLSWSNLAAFGTILSNPTNGPARSVGAVSNGIQFYRAAKTDGLYDPTLLRTISLTFTQNNWPTLLTSARTAGTSVYCSLLTMDNGATNYGVGARYRGNTSFTGMGGGGAPVKKSLNLDIGYSDTNASLMGFGTLNLNNAYGDETIMRESLYFNVMRQYAVSPACCLAQVYINGANWGVYSCAQQENGDLIKEYFPSNDGDRWRAPNMATGGGGGPGGGSSGTSAFGYLSNTNLSTYKANYELKSDYNTNAWPRLIQAIYVLNNTPAAQFRDKVEDYFAVDRWLWFLAIENIFADDDSYWNKGADYCFYYEPESGRIHPVEHDGNEAFTAGDASLTPIRGASDANRPMISKLLAVPELRQRYLAHMRTVLSENFNPAAMTALIDRYQSISVAAITADPKKGYTSMTTYNTDITAIKTFVNTRYKFLTNHAELKPLAPNIVAVYAPTSMVAQGQISSITAQVAANGANGIDSVWLYYRSKTYGRFTSVQMLDDGAHGDGSGNDGVFGASVTNISAGAKVHFYVEARSANSAKAACFAPARAEQDSFSYRVALTTATQSPVLINELMASNKSSLADPQGEFDDWIELRNITDRDVDLTGRYLSDEEKNPKKWQFPAGTKIPAAGYLIVWADEDGTAASGLHASFKLSALGETVYLIDTDENLNIALDYVSFGAQEEDRSCGRTAADGNVWAIMDPTPGAANR
jgi:hypothetical protein